MENLSNVLVGGSINIRHAMKQLSENALQILLVVDKTNKLMGTVTDGDIRRALLENVSLSQPVSRIANTSPKYLYEEDARRAAEIMRKHSIMHVPILNKRRQVVDLALWKDAGMQKAARPYPARNNPVFILAGGAGERLDPFTKILPKPLIPINDKPIIEIIMDNFRKYGFANFILSLNYKGEMIKMYFKDNPQNYKVAYVEEKEFLGTAGSLRLIRKRADKSILVSNCDVILNMNFDELLKYHKAAKNDFTVVGIVRHVKIPYGVITMKNGTLTHMREKPEYDFIVNAGTYVIEPPVIDLIGRNEHINMPELIIKAKKNAFKVGVYPASADWIDIGQWEEYRKALDHMSGTVMV